MAMTDAGGPHRAAERTRHAPASGAAASPVSGVSGLAVDTSTAASWMRNWASQDWIAVTYLSLLMAALFVGKGPNRGACI